MACRFFSEELGKSWMFNFFASMTFSCYRMSSDQENPLLLDVLTASSTSYTANPDEQTLTEVKRYFHRDDPMKVFLN